MDLSHCPICLDIHESLSIVTRGLQGYIVACENCGPFHISELAWEDYLDPSYGVGRKLTAVQRSRLSHRTQMAHVASSKKFPELDTSFVEKFVETGCPDPTPMEQANNLLTYIGDEISKSGDRICSLPRNLHAIVLFRYRNPGQPRRLEYRRQKESCHR